MLVQGLVPCSASGGWALLGLCPPPVLQLPLHRQRMSHGDHGCFKEVFSMLLDGLQL